MVHRIFLYALLAWSGFGASPNILRITAVTEDRPSEGPYSFPPGVRVTCRAELAPGLGPRVSVRWQFMRKGRPLDGAVLQASGNAAAFRLPAEEGSYEIVAIAEVNAEISRFSLPVEVKRRRYPPVPEVGGPALPSAALQRTMSLLATSTADRRKAVRVLFYGQSLTKQDWARTVANDLRTRFPYADLTISNRSIGGYSSPFLIRTLPHDVYSFYPDLIIFHDYGDEPLYEQIIARIRANTTAEILLQSDRPGPPKATGPDTSAWHERHSLAWLPDLAKRFGLEWADLWRPWQAYLAANKLQPGDVLRDGAHYTLQGDYMVARITSRYLVYRPELASAGPKMVRSYEIGRDIAWSGGRLRLEFDGNRIDVLGGWDNPFHGGAAEVWIDGKRPSDIPELYTITLPTDTYVVDWPAINRIGHEKPLIPEDWTLRVTESGADNSRLKFAVIGSRTGPDGEGVSTERFVSRSGRVVIEPADWGVKRAFDLKHIPTPSGFEVHWSVEANFLDVYREQRLEDPSREYRKVLALGLANGHHTLELRATGPFPPVLRALEVFEPPYQP